MPDTKKDTPKDIKTEPAAKAAAPTYAPAVNAASQPAFEELRKRGVTLPTVDSAVTVVDLPLIFHTEEQNTNQAYIYVNDKFFNAYNLSAFLVRQFLWPGATAKIQYVKNFGDGVRVGFPIGSLAKAILAACEAGYTYEPQYNKNHQLTSIVFSGFANYADAYIKWKNDFLSLTHQGKLALTPSYANSQVYRYVFTYLSTIFDLSTHFKPGFRQALQPRLLDALIAVNDDFYQCHLNNGDPQYIIHRLTIMQTRLNDILFLLRLAFENRCYGMEANAKLMEQKAVIDKQLNVWKKKITTNCSQELISSATTPGSTTI